MMHGQQNIVFTIIKTRRVWWAGCMDEECTTILLAKTEKNRHLWSHNADGRIILCWLPWKNLFLKKLIFLHPVKKFSIFYVKQGFIAVLKKTPAGFYPQKSFYHIYLRSTLLLSSHLRPCNASGFSPSRLLPPNRVFLSFPKRATCPTPLTFLNFTIVITFREHTKHRAIHHAIFFSHLQFPPLFELYWSCNERACKFF
jgi:hypothetical protein